jgi:hypothetical protein
MEEYDEIVKELVDNVRDGSDTEWMLVTGVLMAALADAMYLSPEVARMIKDKNARHSKTT